MILIEAISSRWLAGGTSVGPQVGIVLWVEVENGFRPAFIRAVRPIVVKIYIYIYIAEPSL